MLGALVLAMVALLVALIVIVFINGWPSFAHNGLSWFGPGGSVDDQLTKIFNAGYYGGPEQYVFHAWPLIWSTFLTTAGAVAIAFVSSLFAAVFMVEFAPVWLQRTLEPVVRLLASVPPVIYGLVGM